MIWYILGFGLFLMALTFPHSTDEYDDDNGRSYFTVDKNSLNKSKNGSRGEDVAAQCCG